MPMIGRRCVVRSISARVRGRQREDTCIGRWFLVIDGGVVSNNQSPRTGSSCPCTARYEITNPARKSSVPPFIASLRSRTTVQYEANRSAPTRTADHRYCLRLGKDAARLHLWSAFIAHLSPRSPVKRAVADVATVFQRCRETIVYG